LLTRGEFDREGGALRPADLDLDGVGTRRDLQATRLTDPSPVNLVAVKENSEAARHLGELERAFNDYQRCIHRNLPVAFAALP
jgi:hypothetical protein